MKSALIKILVLLAFEVGSYSQGTFRNMDFENPVLPLSVGFVSSASAFPYWNVYIGGIQSSTAVYNTISLGAAVVSLHDSNGVIPIWQGSYTAALQPSFPGGGVVPALGQVGTVPGDAQSVRFYGNGNYTLTFAGQQIPLSVVVNAGSYDVLGGDISAFANQTGELRISGGGSLDNIFFSNQQIPEPGVLGLFGIGTLLLGWQSRLRKD